jgi:hypothetical protein
MYHLLNLLRSRLLLPFLVLPNFARLSGFKGIDEGRCWSAWDPLGLHRDRDISVGGAPVEPQAYCTFPSVYSRTRVEHLHDSFRSNGLDVCFRDFEEL